MFNETQSVDLAETGLVVDTPSNRTPDSAWNDSRDMRAKDGSVQGVYSFFDSFLINTATYPNAKPVAVEQWTPAGSNFENIAYIIDDGTGKGRTFVHNTDTNLTAEITNGTFDLDLNYPPQIFVFNEILIVNSGVDTPQYISADATTSGTLADLPNWSDLTTTQFPRIMRPFGTRLVAMNFHDSSNGKDYPIDFVWSSVVTTISSISEVVWQASNTNTAGDAFLTATPGKIIDGKQLGTDFILIKSDALVRVVETGDTTFPLTFSPLFEDDGGYSTGCVTNIGSNLQVIFGNYGIYFHDGQANKTDIGKGIFQEALFNDINPLHRHRSFVFQQTRDKEVWFCYSSKTNSGAGCDKAYVYDYQAKKIHFRTLPNVLDMYESELNGQLKIYAASPDSTSILELSDTDYVADGYIYMTDKNLGSFSLTKDVSSLFVTSEGSVKIYIAGTYELSGTKVFTATDFDPTTDYKVDVRINGRYISIGAKMDGTTNPKLTKVSLNTRLGGGR